MPKFVDDNYFGEITEHMVKKGFTLLSYVQISNDERYPFGYHVSTPNARSTALFFHYPNRCLIVRLEYSEDNTRSTLTADSEFYSDKMWGNWTVDIHTQFRDYRELVNEIYVSLEERPDLTRDDVVDGFDYHYRSDLKIPLYNWKISPKHLTVHGRQGRLVELYGSSEPTDPELIVADVWQAVEKGLPYLKSYPFDDLQVTDFPPHYSFPGCEEHWWFLFDANGQGPMRGVTDRYAGKSYLRSLVTKLWGTKGLKR